MAVSRLISLLGCISGSLGFSGGLFCAVFAVRQSAATRDPVVRRDFAPRPTLGVVVVDLLAFRVKR